MVLNKYENVYFHWPKKWGYFPAKQNVAGYEATKPFSIYDITIVYTLGAII
jgi:hypothetical protein